MNRLLKVILKIICIILIVIVILTVLVYSGLWIYSINFTPEEYKKYYKDFKIIELHENQYEIIQFTLARNKNYELKWKPFILDMFLEYSLKDNYDNVDYLTANSILFRLNANRIPSIQWHILNYTFTRYISFDNNWKKSLSIIISHGYYGNGVYDIRNAAEYYYNKNIKEVTENELISLTLLNFSSNRYEIGSLHSKEKTNEIYILFCE